MEIRKWKINQFLISNGSSVLTTSGFQLPISIFYELISVSRISCFGFIKYMFLIIGLGNPGFKYLKTHHNIGFMALDSFQKENHFPKFRQNKKAKVEISKALFNAQEVFLVKPQTYMNNSGSAVKFLTKENGFNENSLIVVHDDFDLPFGEIKTAQNSGSAGHRGVQSIIDCLKTQNFTRIRIGIRPNCQLPPKQSLRDATGQATANCQLNPKAENFVLEKFSKEEEKQLPQIMKNARLVISESIIKPSERSSL